MTAIVACVRACFMTNVWVSPYLYSLSFVHVDAV